MGLHTHQDTDRDKRRHQRRAAEAHERQRYADDGNMPVTMPMLTKA